MLEVDAWGPAATDEVWRRYSEPSHWPSWAPQIRGVRGLGNPLAADDRGWVLGPFPLWLPCTVLSVDPAARRWTWRVGVGPASVVMEHGVDPQGTGSRAWARIALPRPLALPYAPLARVALRRLVRAEGR